MNASKFRVRWHFSNSLFGIELYSLAYDLFRFVSRGLEVHGISDRPSLSLVHREEGVR
jgi:hypothetical protein